jgi:hypothetical protein
VQRTVGALCGREGDRSRIGSAQQEDQIVAGPGVSRSALRVLALAQDLIVELSPADFDRAESAACPIELKTTRMQPRFEP